MFHTFADPFEFYRYFLWPFFQQPFRVTMVLERALVMADPWEFRPSHKPHGHMIMIWCLASSSHSRPVAAPRDQIHWDKSSPSTYPPLARLLILHQLIVPPPEPHQSSLAYLHWPLLHLLHTFPDRNHTFLAPFFTPLHLYSTLMDPP